MSSSPLVLRNCQGLRHHRLWPLAVAAGVVASIVAPAKYYLAASRTHAPPCAFTGGTWPLVEQTGFKVIPRVQRPKRLRRSSLLVQDQETGLADAELDAFDDDLDGLADDLESLLGNLDTESEGTHSEGNSAAAEGEDGINARLEEPTVQDEQQIQAKEGEEEEEEQEEEEEEERVEEGDQLSLATAADGLQATMQQVGLQIAPADVGSGVYLATVDDIRQIVELRTQKFKSIIASYDRYAKDLESELAENEERLEMVEARLQEEQRLRLQAEQDRDAFVQRQASLEAQVVEASVEQRSAEEQLDDLDRKADEISQRLANNEITEEEAERQEEELMRAEARRLNAKQTLQSSQDELAEVNLQVEEATARASSAVVGESELQSQLAAMQAQVEQLTEERDAKAQKAAEADERFNRLVQKISEKVERKRAGDAR